MSQLYYLIPISEEFVSKENCYKINTNLPHHDMIKTWLPKEWDKCNIPNTFYGILKDKIASAPMSINQEKNGCTIAVVTIHFIKGFRVTKKRRNECFAQLDAQLSDGFGETMDGHQIPGADTGWQLYL